VRSACGSEAVVRATGPAPLEGRRYGKATDACKLCGKPKAEWERGRRTWCGEACVTRYNVATSVVWLRAAVLRRDAGVCASCGLDCGKLDARLSRFGVDERNQALEVLETNGFPKLRWRWPISTWSADHIDALAEGGSPELSNIQTLCLSCHAEKTAEHMGRRAKQRRLLGVKWTRQRARRLLPQDLERQETPGTEETGTSER